MNELTRQVQRAKRRLNRQQLLRTLVWSLFAALLVAAIGLAIPKIWPLAVESRLWMWSWVGGATIVGLFSAAVWTYVIRFSSLDAAIEIDRRFGLKERVSSTLALSERERDSEIGRALVTDAVRRVERIEVSEQFQVTGRWWNLLPLLPAIAVFGLAVFVPDAVRDDPNTTQAAVVDVKSQVRNSTNQLKKKIAERRNKAKQEGLEDAGLLFERLEKGVERLNKASDVDKKKAMVRLNDLADEIRKRRETLGNREEMQKRLNQLRNLQQGPADRLSKAIKNGDFNKALDELDNLRQQLAEGKLNAEQKEQLARQMKQMADKLKQLADAHEQAKQDLERKIKQLKKAGNMAEAGELQRKLDKMNNMNRQMDQLRQMAQRMGNCSRCMKEGNIGEAAKDLEALVANLEDLQADLDEMELLGDAMDEIAQAKDLMNCGQCNGMGCNACLGMGNIPGMGMREGHGMGDRPEEDTDSQFYNSQVRAEVRKGQAVVVGTANGPNIAGDTLEEAKSALEQASTDDADPLTGHRLPKAQRNHARQYFNAVGVGE
jgi:HAMP domain-containing protein